MGFQLAKWDGFRTENLINVIEHPDMELEQTHQLLNI